jgi:polyisoprenoid-binding protein YceI
MRRFTIISLLLVIWMAACSPQAVPAQVSTIPATAAQAAAAPTATLPPPAPAAAQPSATPRAGPTATAAPGSPSNAITPPPGTVAYKIVPGESQVSYQVTETFINQNNKVNVAIGVTKVVNGEIYGDKSNPANSRMGEITVDVSKFTSDSGQRDNMIRRNFLQSSQYPLAHFVPNKVDGLPASYTDGQDDTFKVTGDLTVKQTTKPVTFDVTARLTGDTLTGKATTKILMSDFGVGPISLLGMLNTQDEVQITFDFVARP